MSGRVVHFEVPFDDVDLARNFYREVFGWETEQMAEMDYTSAMTGPVGEMGMPTEPGYVNGGMFQRQGGRRPSGDHDRRRRYRGGHEVGGGSWRHRRR